MTLPAFLFGCLIAILLGSLFHLWKGGGFWQILLYFLFSLAGFWIGHLAAAFFDINLWNVGPIHFGPSILLSIVFLLIARWLFNFPAPDSKT